MSKADILLYYQILRELELMDFHNFIELISIIKDAKGITEVEYEEIIGEYTAAFFSLSVLLSEV